MDTSQPQGPGLSPRAGLGTPPTAVPPQGMAVSPTVSHAPTPGVIQSPGVTSANRVTMVTTTMPVTSGPSIVTGVAKPTSAMSAAEMVTNIQTRIALLSQGPQTPKQKEEVTKLQQVLSKAQAGSLNSTGNSSITVPSKIGDSPGMTGVPSGTPVGTSSPSMGAPRAPTQSGHGSGEASGRVLEKRRLQELIKEVDPLEQLDDDVEEMLMQIADDFIDNVVTAACQLAKHRKANTVEVKDVQLHLERNWNMWIPGFGSEELRPFKKAATTEAHKQRMALIKKTLKKY